MSVDALRHYPQLDAHVHCAGEIHRLRWHAGELIATDHVDAEGERVLTALGGQRFTCIDALEIWAHHLDDLRILILTRRGPTDQVVWPKPSSDPSVALGTGATVDLLGRQRGSVVFAAPTTAPPSPSPEEQLVGLLALDARLADHLAITVAATWAERLAAGDVRARSARAALTAILHGRVTSTVRSWLGEPDLQVDVDMIDPDAPPTLTRTADGIHAFLPFEWIVNVWGRNPVISDRLALAVLDCNPERLSLLTTDHTFGEPRPLTLSLG
jgi:hypothetical protein